MNLLSPLPPSPFPLPPDLAEALARAADRLGVFGRDVRFYSEVTSTSDIAATLAERGAPEGAVIVADAQTAGRGRQGRAWASPPAAGLYFSVVLKPSAPAMSLLTIAAGVAVADAIQSATGLETRLKWPNDVYVGDRKLAGVLAEAAPSQYVILGVGINVMPGAYPPDIAARATSIEHELGRPVDRGLLLAECLCALAEQYAALHAGRAADVLKAWRERAASMLGRRVAWTADGVTQQGVAEAIDDTGALLVRTDARVVRVISGEVIWA